MLLPKKVKHRKWHKGRRRNLGVASRHTTVAFGSYGLRAETYGWVTSRQLEAARRVLTRYVKRGGKIWIRVFPDRPVTKKGSEVPMGGGKGSPDHYVCTVKPGTVLFEMDGITETSAKEALESAGYKLPIKGRFVAKQ
ncbi:MAG TPA: 50S ribosomal protein L16 [Candidatus Kapabacteria bacterium]|nr:50S ribosomal protein L16 [Candidatus Kapabacteria bacterium]